MNMLLDINQFFSNKLLFYLLIFKFYLKYAFSQLECECRYEKYNEDITTGIFKSPMFPRHYCNNLECVYEVIFNFFL